LNVAVVIQARVGSTRFPGKVLAPLQGRPLLDHVLERAAMSRCASTIVLATSTNPGDDALVDVARARGAVVVRGPEDDVLARFLAAIDAAGPDIVVRLTGDCPLLDPRLIDRVVRALVRDGADYASNVEPPSYPDGYDVEAMPARRMREMSAEALLPYQREHVTAVAREAPDRYRHATVVSRRDHSGLRLTVDTPADLERIDAVLRATGRQTPMLGAVLRAVNADPRLRDNAGLPARDERYLAQRDAARTAARGGPA